MRGRVDSRELDAPREAHDAPSTLELSIRRFSNGYDDSSSMTYIPQPMDSEHNVFELSYPTQRAAPHSSSVSQGGAQNWFCRASVKATQAPTYSGRFPRG